MFFILRDMWFHEGSDSSTGDLGIKQGFVSGGAHRLWADSGDCTTSLYPTRVWGGEGVFYSVCPGGRVLAGVSDTSANGAVTVVFFVAWGFWTMVVHLSFFGFQEAVMFWIGISWVAIVGDGNIGVGIVCVVVVGVGFIVGVVIMRV